MRYLLPFVVLAVLVIPAFADEQTDIQAVERELRLENQAVELYQRARERAENAVRYSSIGAELDRLDRAWKKILYDKDLTREYKHLERVSNAAHRDARQARTRASIRAPLSHLDPLSFVDNDPAVIRAEKRKREADKRFKKIHLARNELKRSRDSAMSKYNRFVRKMTTKFIYDEIEKLHQKIRDDMSRRIKELMKRKKPEVI